ncbi:chain-length determining protein [Cellulomonas aerilata]|uniref:Polysaccharide chain length determinant N-terminal domain-containing protein n=1 Tax=Cellulomonas aerilata TaxID=515326 RepID=A0A512DA32_9CELL|nr:chain-length determining protein [Cellulomonas aerilata]GEO33329.1 hypothetical protein CAE01nite_10540 [Cellulomonas aerilata]
MDPTEVLRVLWRQRWYVAPAVLVALVAAAYVFQLAPRSYQSTGTYALVNPNVPSSQELEADPDLAALNGDNPYLRSADTNLVTDALMARLGTESTLRHLEAAGVGTEFAVGPGVGGNGFVVDVTGVGPTPAESIATTAAVGTVLEDELRELQTVHGADDRFLFTPLVLAEPESATEQFSSRLRATIVVLLGGGVLVFGAASLGRYRETSRSGRPRPDRSDRSDRPETGPVPGPATASQAPHVDVLRHGTGSLLGTGAATARRTRGPVGR